jgi:hypothetical protein
VEAVAEEVMEAVAEEAVAKEVGEAVAEEAVKAGRPWQRRPWRP